MRLEPRVGLTGIRTRDLDSRVNSAIFGILFCEVDVEFVCLVLLDLDLLEPFSSTPQLQYEGGLLEAITAKEKQLVIV